MRHARAFSIFLFIIAVAGGTLSQPAGSRILRMEEGYWPLAADLHVHGFFGDGALPPWEIRDEAERRGLDVVAITNHNQLVAGRIGKWWSAGTPGPLVLVGEEITAPHYHLVAAGTTEPVDWRQPAEDAIAAIHRQGGVAIAAHAIKKIASGFNDVALARIDGIEVAHPIIYSRERYARELAAFADHARTVNPGVAPIGSTDFHFRAPMGLCRTYVLAREATEAGVLDAIRQGRTVAYDATGRAYGDPRFIAIADRQRAVGSIPSSAARRLAAGASSAGALAGLVGWILFAPPGPRARPG